MTKILSNFISRRDFFGHQIQLNFNKRGSSHNTVCGGLVSMFISVIMLAYFLLLFERLYLHEQDQISLINQSQNFTNIGKVNYTDLDGQLSIRLADAKTQQPVQYGDDQRKFINITFEEISWANGKTNGVKAVQFRKCNQKDINNFKEHEQKFDFFQYLCPNFENNQTFQLQNTITTIQGTRIGMKIKRCDSNNKEGVVCGWDYEIDEFIQNKEIHIHYMTEIVDFTKRDGQKPVFQSDKWLSSSMLLKDQMFRAQIYLRENQIESYEQLFPIGFATYAGRFFNIGSFNSFLTVPPSSEENTLLDAWITLDEILNKHQRNQFSVLDLIGNLGGVLDLFIIPFALFLGPFSEHSFNLKAIQRLFVAQTKNRTMFKQKKAKESKMFKAEHPELARANDKIKESIQHELETFYEIKLSCFKRFKVYILKSLCSCCFTKSKSKKKLSENAKLYKLYNEGSEKLEKELSVENILKDLRDMKIYLKQYLMDAETEFKIQYDHQNVIFLDDQDVPEIPRTPITPNLDETELHQFANNFSSLDDSINDRAASEKLKRRNTINHVPVKAQRKSIQDLNPYSNTYKAEFMKNKFPHSTGITKKLSINNKK